MRRAVSTLTLARMLVAAGMLAATVLVLASQSSPAMSDAALLRSACAQRAPALATNDPDFETVSPRGQVTGVVACTPSGGFACWIVRPAAAAVQGRLEVYAADPGCG